jgi:cation:H+ antiporter
MTLAFLSIGAGLVLLVWSADRFVEGSASIARHLGMPPLLIGMVIVGFGTSAPEMVVSALAAAQGTPGIALGNAYGSNIANIGLILGVTALMRPIAVHSRVLRAELPILTAVTALAAWLCWNGTVTRLDALVLVAVFAGLLTWSLRQATRTKPDTLAHDVDRQLSGRTLPVRRAVVRLTVGLTLLLVSSRALVWGAVRIAHAFGVSDLLIGLTVVAVGTSLPELASSLMAARRGEHDLALGNVLGSNLFNTLAVVGLAGLIRPLPVAPEILSRDLPVLAALTISLFVIGFGLRRPGRVNRIEGAVLLSGYVAYAAYLVITALRP